MLNSLAFIILIIQRLLQRRDIFELAEIKDDGIFVVFNRRQMYQEPDWSFSK